MPSFRLASLQVRITLLVLLAALPALALTIYTNVEERRFKAAQVREGALRLARLISVDHERLIEAARQLLVTLARLPAVRGGDVAACTALFNDLLRQYPSYANFGVASPTGQSTCSGVGGSTHVGDRTWFRGALATRDFSVGTFQIGRLTGRATLNFGYPVLDERGEVQAVVFSALDLAWVNQVAARANLPPDSMLTVTDRDGLVLARYPAPEHWIGKPMPESAVREAIRAQGGAGTTDASGTDGILRLVAFTPLTTGRQEADAYVSVGIPTTVAFAAANRELARNLITLGLVTALAMTAAWIGGRLFIVRPARALVGATRQLGAGDLGARARLPADRGELSELGRAFDEMAESLERAHARRLREEELARKNYALEQDKRAAEAANRLKSEFVSMVSHELRTPLTSIEGYVDLLQEEAGPTLTAEQRESLATIGSNAERLLALINDLLDLSRIEAGRIELHRSAVEAPRLIQDVQRALRPLIESKRQQLVLDMTDAVPAIWADPDRVTQILTNLVSNANKYTPAGGRITIAARPDGPFARIDIQDTGRGLSPEEQAQLFTRFFRARAAGGPGGTGLGLVITRLLVEAHGGRIAVASAPETGATFSVWLPAAPPPTETPPR